MNLKIYKMKKTIETLTFLLAGLIIFGCSSENPGEEAQKEGEAINEILTVSENMELIQFHAENRCMTCNKIEANSLKTLKAIEGISFRLVNVDQNEEEANLFEAAGTALFLHNKETGAKKELTDFAFMNAGDEEKFMNGLIAEIKSFK